MNNIIITQYKLYHPLSYILRIQTEEEHPAGRQSQVQGDWVQWDPSKHDPVKAHSMLKRHGPFCARSGAPGVGRDVGGTGLLVRV